MNFESASGISDYIAYALGFFGLIFVFIILVYAFTAIVETKILRKANHKNPWAGWVPVYRRWVLAEIAGLEGYLSLIVCFGYVIPVIGSIASIITLIIIYDKLAKSFGKDVGFTIGLIFLPLIFLSILAFGSSEYVGPAGSNDKEPKIWEAKE